MNEELLVGVGFQPNLTGLNTISKQLDEIIAKAQNMSSTQNKSKNGMIVSEKDIETLKKFKNIYTDSWNSNLGRQDLTKFNSQLKAANIDLKQCRTLFQNLDNVRTFDNIAKSILTTNLQLKKSKTLLDDLAQTMTNTVKWGITSSLFNTMTNSIQGAWNYAKALDSSLNDIRIVTGKSSDEMARFATQANKAAKSLGAATKNYSNASLIYYQQGLNEQDVQARAKTTLKTANVTGQTGQEVSEQLTAVWNGYKVSAQEAELYVDKLAAVAAETAADLEELSTGMSKVASAANLMGVDIDQLNAQLATIVSVTRQAPESVGTALKTIYARMGDIKAGLDGEVTLDEYTSQMAEMGVHVLDANGQLRDMGTVIEEIGSKWTSMTREQQISLSQIMAGTRQYNNLLSLFDNWNMYTKALNTSANAAGTLQKQQEIYMDSLSARLQSLSTEIERTYDIIFDEDKIKGFLSGITEATKLLNNLLNVTSKGALLTGPLGSLGTFGASIFSSQIGQGLAKQALNKQKTKQMQAEAGSKEPWIDLYANSGIVATEGGLNTVVKASEKIAPGIANLTEEQQQEFSNAIFELGKTTSQIEYYNTKSAELLKGTAFAEKILEKDNDGNEIEHWVTKKDVTASSLNQYVSEYNTASSKVSKAKDDLKTVQNRIKQNKILTKEDEAKIAAIVQKDINEAVKKAIDENLEVTKKTKEEDYPQALKEQIKNIREGELSQDAHREKVEAEYIDKRIAKDKERESQLKTEINKNNKLIKDRKDYVENVAAAAKEHEDIESGIVNKLTQSNAEHQKTVDNLTEEALLAHKYANGIQLASSALNILQTGIGLIRVWMDEDLTNSEKIEQTTVGLGNMGIQALMAAQAVKELGGAKEILGSLGKAWDLLKVKVSGALSAIWKVAMAHPVIAVIIGAITALLVSLNLIFKTQEKKAEELANKIEDLSNAYNQAKQSAENFKKSISDYSKAREELDKLDKDTQEYINKVKEANELSLQLLAENPDLANQVTRDKHGVLTFSEEALNEISQRKNQAATSLGIAKLEAQIEQTDFNIKQTLKEVDSLKVKNYRTIEDINNEVLSNNQGNIDLKNRPQFKQDDGSLSTVNSIIVSNEKGEYIVIPTIRQDKYNKAVQMSDKEAEDYFNSTGEFLGKFDKLSEAEYYARDLHNSQDYLYNDNYSKTVKKLSDEEMKDIYSSIADYAVEHNLKTITEEELVQITELKNLETDIIKTLASEDNIIALKGALGTLVQQKALQKQYYIEANKMWLENNTELNKYSNLEQTYTAHQMYKNRASEEEEKANITEKRKEIAERFKTDEEYLKEAYNIFAESKGYKTLTVNDSIDDYGTAMPGFDYKFVSEDEHGKEKSEYFIKSAVLEKQMAKLELQKEQAASILSSLDTFKENAKSVEGIDVYSKVLEGTIAEGNKISLQDQMAQLSPTEAKAYSEMDTETFKQHFGITDEIIEQAGYDVVEEFQSALKNYGWTKEGAIDQALKSEELYQTEGLEIEEVEEYVSHLMDIAKVSDDVADSLIENADAAEVVATSIMRMNNGINTLADNFKDWNSILNKSDKSSLEYAQAMAEMKNALADVFDTESEYIDQEFVHSHLKDIEKIAKGDAEAIEKVRAELADRTLYNISFSNNLTEDLKNKLTRDLDALQQDINNRKIEVGAELKGDDAIIHDMQKIIDAAQMTKEQANALFASMGFEATYEESSEPTKYVVPEYTTHTTITDRDIFGNPTETVTWTEQTGEREYKGEFTTSAMAVKTPDGEGSTPKITKITKKGTGSMNNYSSSNKGGGGPGKSGGSDKKPDKKEPLENEKDVYHDINIILKQISTELDRLETQEKKLVGQDLIDNLNEQWGRLQDTIDATNEKIRIARGEMSRLQGELSAKGVTFNPDGTIANYAAAYDQQLATVNAVINHYNSLSADAQEGYKDTVEQAEKNWEEFLDNISEYDELVSEMIPELEDEIQAAIDEQIEIQIEKFNMEIELRLDMAEAEREWNEFKKRIIDDIEDDDILGNASAKLLDYNSYYKEDGTGVIQKNTQHVNEIIEQLKSIEATGTSSIYGDNEAQALEDLKTYYEQLMSDLTDVHDLIDEIRESYLDMMDEAQDKFDEQVETYEYIRDLLTHDMDLITMVYGDEAYDKLVDFYEKQEDNYNKQLDFQRQQKDFWKAQMDSLEEGSDEWQKAKENWMSAVEEWNSLVEEAIENLQDKYLNAINNIFANLNDKVTGGLGLDYVEQEWDLINKNADQYLDTINAVFETQQLENKYLDAIDNTDNISAQRKLNDLMKEEIKALEQKDKLTQYDIDRANLKYEIALKQIALEEAQQTKSSMRLRRDSQGNYRYEFVADNDAIAEAEDELSVLQNQLYNMDVEQYRSNLDQLYEIYVEWQEALAEAAQINDPEARAERELMINEQYGELINGIVEENEVIKTNLRESAFDELVNLHQMELEEVQALSQAEKDIMLEDMVPQWTSGVQTMADVFVGEGGFIPTCKDALNDLNNATQDYEDSLLELQYQGGFTFNDIVAGENEAIYTAMGLLQVNNQLIGSYQAEFDALRNVLSQLDGLIGKYGAAQNAANAAAEAAYKYADALLAQFAAAQGEYTGRGRFYNSGGAGIGGNISTLPSSYSGSGTGEKNIKNTSPNKDPNSNSSGDGTTYFRYVKNGNGALDTTKIAFQSSADGSKWDTLQTYTKPTSLKDMGKMRDWNTMLGTARYIGAFATGGYTGNWNSSEGKIGILHQKELVLNQRDTENILGAIEIMRNITSSIDNSVFERMAQMQTGFGITHPELENGVLEQNVHIEANFPNVQSSEEIKEAINNLTNIASQRANKSTRY